MKVDLAAGFQRLGGLPGEGERGGELVRMDRLVLRLQFFEGALEQHIGGDIAFLPLATNEKPAGCNPAG
jgi:hypothetical protein